MSDYRKPLAWAALLAVVLLGVFLGVREGTHRAKQAQDAKRLAAARAELAATRDSLRSTRARVDTVRELLVDQVQRVDTLLVSLEATAARAEHEELVAARLRRRADSLLQLVPPRTILDAPPAVRAAYAYRQEADSLRGANRRLQSDLDATTRSLNALKVSQMEAAARLEAVGGSLATREAEISSLRDTIAEMRAARECRIPLVGMTCPSRGLMALIGAGAALYATR